MSKILQAVKTVPAVSLPRYCLGIDPGAGGGLAALGVDGSVHQLTTMPDEEWQVLQWFEDYGPPENARAIQESVGGYIPGSKGNIGSAMFTFGWNACVPWMGMVASKIHRKKVQPNTWQKALGVPGKRKGAYSKETDSQYKARLRRFAQELFPAEAEDITNSTCDALLIAEYCRRLVIKGDY